jgi:energy-coupling factor transporter ATP-binding protein EcfA2
MNELAQKQLLQVNAIAHLKKLQLLNPTTAQMVLQDPVALMKKLGEMNEVLQMFQSPFESPDDSVNELIKFMTTENNMPVGFNPLDCHVLIAGQTGCGKSTLLKIIFTQILLFSAQSAPFKAWLFVKAKDMRPLLKVNKDIVVARFKEIKLNPLQPPQGIKTIDWASIFVDVFTQVFYLLGASKALLIECLNELYERFEKQNHYPSLFDLYDHVKALKVPGFSRTAGYRESILNRLTGLLNGAMGETFNCSRGHIDLLANRNVIFELLYLTGEQQVFLVNYLLSYLFNSKLINETATRHFVGIDDGNQIFDSSFEKRPDLGLPIIHHLLTTVRKAKINIFALTQTPHQTGASINSNAFAKIMFSLSNGKDVEFMQQSMGIKDPTQKQYCYNIPAREAVVKFSGRYQKPFVARVPDFSIGDDVIGDDLVILNNRRLLLDYKIQPRFKPTCVVQGEQNNQSTESNPALPKKGMDSKTHDFLMAVNLHQYKTTLTEIYKLANLTAGTGSRVAKSCEKNNLIKIVKVSFGRGRPRYPVLLPEAYSVLGIKEKKFYGKGAGHEHVLYQHLIAQHFSKFKPVIELNRGGKFIDVGIEANEQLIAIEVAMTAVHEKANIEKDLSKAKAFYVIVACLDEKVFKKVGEIVSKLPEETKEKTRICLVSKLLNENPDEFIEDLTQPRIG